MEEIRDCVDDVVYVDGFLEFYKDGEMFTSINVNSDLRTELVGLINSHTHSTEDIVDYDEKTSIEIKKAYRLLSNQIRTYGA